MEQACAKLWTLEERWCRGLRPPQASSSFLVVAAGAEAIRVSLGRLLDCSVE